jgi:hypothetical protein
MSFLTRRSVFLGLAFAATPGAVLAFDDTDLDPSDTVPRSFSVKRFLALSENEVYRVNIALKRGRRIIIEGCSASESREIIRLAQSDPEAAKQRLLEKTGSHS